jgi:hypothetical protein
MPKKKAGSTYSESTQQPMPDPDLKKLDRLVGTWRLSGDVEGQIKYEYTEGGFFLIQYVDMSTPTKYGRRRVKGIEIIGHQQRIGEKPSREIKSRFYEYMQGLTLDYVYELKRDILTIWFGDKGSNNRFKGKFGPDGRSYSGEWKWPGGGYKVTATRLD